ncbi:hypothetical protein ACS0TY_008432 [Phlomoides rotata]
MYAQHLLWQALERPLLKSGLPSVTQKERVQQAEPQQVFQTEHQASKPDVSGQPSTSGAKEGEISLRPQKGPKRVATNVTSVKSCWFFNNTCENLLNGVEFDAEHFITDVSGKYPRLWALKGAHLVNVNRWYKFGALASIRMIAPRFREISNLLDWHNNPHLKRGEELEIKFITTASDDMTNAIQYPSFHFMKLQRPDQRTFTYIKAQETKPALVVNLTKDEVSTRRAWGVWVCLTEMEKVKYPFKIYQNSIN